MRRPNKQFIPFVSACCLLLPATVFADSGSTLREYKDTTILAPEKKQAEEIKYEEAATANTQGAPVMAGPMVHVDKINVVGQTVLSPEALHQVLVPYTGHALSTSEIHAAADALMAEVRKAGAFLAKVYILPQDIVDNTVTFNVIEGHLATDGVVLGRSSARVADDVIRDQLVHTLQPCTTITADKYERAIYLTNDLPGIKGSENLIFPADKVGEAGFETTVEDEDLITGNLYYDNFGSTYTGRNRWGTTVEFNSPFGRAEKFTSGGNISDLGTVFGYLDASMLLYPNGLRGGVAIDYLDYATDEAYDLHGNALDGSTYLHYPIIRSRRTNLSTDLRYTYTTLEDEDDRAMITDRLLHVGSLQLSADHTDTVLGGGVTTARIEGYAGSVNLDDYAPYKEYDARHADTQGGFSRATASLTRLQHLIGQLQTYLAVNGQLASKHMDASQSISFGGPYDFPGYYAGEIFGDEGWTSHADLRYTFSSLPWQGELQLSVFYDYGWIKTHTVAVENGFAVPGSVDHSYHLQTTGFGMNQNWEHFQLQGVLGWQVDNEIHDALLDDRGGNNFQGWIRLAYTF